MERAEKNFEARAERIARIAHILKGIGHEVRLKLIELLHQQGGRSVQELQEALEVEQSVLSHHLAKMRDLGLLSTERDGQRIRYGLKDEELARIIDCMEKCDIF
jgi:ArsR family transcriptional regulator